VKKLKNRKQKQQLTFVAAEHLRVPKISTHLEEKQKERKATIN